MPAPPDRDYWNHNTAYHAWLIDIAAQHRGDVLDVGCGDGLLVKRLAPVSRSVIGIDPDPAAIERATERLAAHEHVTVSTDAFGAYDAGHRRFDLITFVASLHHMHLQESLTKARELLTPTGEIAIVGLTANKSVLDWAWAVTTLPIVLIGSRLLHSATNDIGVAVTDPRENLEEIRRIADDVLPGATVRRALYYRYLLRWANGSIHSSA